MIISVKYEIAEWNGWGCAEMYPQKYTLQYSGILIFLVIAGVCSAEQSQKKGHKITPVQWLYLPSKTPAPHPPPPLWDVIKINDHPLTQLDSKHG